MRTRPGLDQDIDKIGKLRDGDDIFAMVGVCHRLYVSSLWRDSLDRYAVVDGDKVIGLCGCYRKSPWFAGTDDIKSKSATRLMVIEGRRICREWRTKHGKLITYVKKDLKWMIGLGFEVTGPVRVNKEKYYIATMR